LVGIPRAGLGGLDLMTLVHPQDRSAVLARVRGVLGGTEDRCAVDLRVVRPDGEAVAAVMSVVASRDAADARQLVVQLRDVTDSQMQSEMLTHRAMHDTLTGLANRAQL